MQPWESPSLKWYYALPKMIKQIGAQYHTMQQMCLHQTKTWNKTFFKHTMKRLLLANQLKHTYLRCFTDFLSKRNELTQAMSNFIDNFQIRFSVVIFFFAEIWKTLKFPSINCLPDRRTAQDFVHLEEGFAQCPPVSPCFETFICTEQIWQLFWNHKLVQTVQ